MGTKLVNRGVATWPRRSLLAVLLASLALFVAPGAPAAGQEPSVTVTPTSLGGTTSWTFSDGPSCEVNGSFTWNAQVADAQLDTGAPVGQQVIVEFSVLGSGSRFAEGDCGDRPQFDDIFEASLVIEPSAGPSENAIGNPSSPNDPVSVTVALDEGHDGEFSVSVPCLDDPVDSCRVAAQTFVIDIAGAAGGDPDGDEPGGPSAEPFTDGEPAFEAAADDLVSELVVGEGDSIVQLAWTSNASPCGTSWGIRVAVVPATIEWDTAVREVTSREFDVQFAAFEYIARCSGLDPFADFSTPFHGQLLLLPADATVEFDDTGFPIIDAGSVAGVVDPQGTIACSDPTCRGTATGRSYATDHGEFQAILTEAQRGGGPSYTVTPGAVRVLGPDEQMADVAPGQPTATGADGDDDQAGDDLSPTEATNADSGLVPDVPVDAEQAVEADDGAGDEGDGVNVALLALVGLVALGGGVAVAIKGLGSNDEPAAPSTEPSAGPAAAIPGLVDGVWQGAKIVKRGVGISKLPAKIDAVALSLKLGAEAKEAFAQANVLGSLDDFSFADSFTRYRDAANKLFAAEQTAINTFGTVPSSTMSKAFKAMDAIEVAKGPPPVGNGDPAAWLRYEGKVLGTASVGFAANGQPLPAAVTGIASTTISAADLATDVIAWGIRNAINAVSGQ